MTYLQQSFKAAPRGFRIVLAAAPVVLAMSSGIALALQSAPRSTSGTASQLVALAKSGNVLNLPPAVNGETLNISNRKFHPAITIDLSRVSLSGIVIRDSAGIILKNGKVNGPGGKSYGINVVNSKNIRIQAMTVSGSHRGIVIGRSQSITVVNNQLVGLLSDGVNIALSQGVLVQGNRCADFTPTPAIRDADGNLIEDGDHPDCIQAWSRPDGTPTGDVKVVGNSIEGRMSGIFFGNHVRNGVDDGGFDRILIENNDVRVSSYHGVTLYAARGGSMRNNRVTTLPGLTNPKPPHRPVKASIRMIGTTGVIACGNTVDGRSTDVKC